MTTLPQRHIADAAHPRSLAARRRPLWLHHSTGQVGCTITCIETAHAVQSTPTTRDTLALVELVQEHLHPDDDPLPIESTACRLAEAVGLR